MWTKPTATVLGIDAPATVAAPNLTSGAGGVAASYEVEDWVRAIRHGLSPGGRVLFVMPAEVYRHLSDDDLGALVAFLEVAPPVDRSWPPPKPGPVGRILRATGALDEAFPFLYLDHSAPRAPAPPAGATAEYGEYLARTFGYGKEDLARLALAALQHSFLPPEEKRAHEEKFRQRFSELGVAV